ncbi:MAG: methionyl-tRNA formyltransferase, partial [Chryseobacterium sp.]
LHDRLMELGSDAVVQTLSGIASGEITTTIQQETRELKTAYKLNRENCKIDWDKPAVEIHNLVRGLSPYPSAWCWFTDNGEEMSVKIYATKVIDEAHELPVGAIVSTKKDIMVAVTDGFIEVLSLQLPGKKKMTPRELLNGTSFSQSAKAS